jgi:uncharacterized cupredoxin-like copper-binding protein
MLRTIPAIAFAIAAVAAPSVARSTRTFKNVPVITVHAKEFAFAAPTTVAPGQTTFRLVNDGKQLHHLSILQLAKGKTFADVQAALKNPAAFPTWLIEVGGPNAAVPGATVEATLTLEAGNYIIACWIPSPGEQAPHAVKGMLQPLTVAAGGVMQAGAATAPAPVPDVHLVVKDYGFKFSKPLTAGKHVVHVMNEGPQGHEVIFVQLAPGKHASDFVTWATTGGMKGPPPAKPIDGMAGLSKGRTGIFPVDLAPGNYAITCFVPDSKDQKTHAQHGMTTEFTVAAK